MKITRTNDKYLIEVDDMELGYLADGMDLKEAEVLQYMEVKRSVIPGLYKSIHKKVQDMACMLHEIVMGR